MSADHKTKVAIIIVNYQSAHLVTRLLDSLLTETKAAQLKVFIVDNASADDSLAVLKVKLAHPPYLGLCQLLPATTNAGFAAGNNLILRELQGDAGFEPSFIWLLNPDTEIRSGALKAMLEWMAVRSDAGICGSQLFAVNGQPHVSAFRFHSLITEALSATRWGRLSKWLSRFSLIQPVSGHQPVRTDWVPGASMLIRASLLRDIGLFDENFFLYFEETDFCLKAHRAGWTCWLVQQSQVIHIEGQSTGIGQHAQKQRLPAYWFASRRYYFRKNHGLLYALLADSIWIMAYCSWRLRRFVQAKPNTDPPHFLRDFVRHGTLANLLRHQRSLK